MTPPPRPRRASQNRKPFPNCFAPAARGPAALAGLLTLVAGSVATGCAGPGPAGTGAPAAADGPAAVIGLRERAEAELLAAARHPDPQLRVRVMEAAEHLPRPGTVIADGVRDAHPAVRYAAWTAAGRLRLPPAAYDPPDDADAETSGPARAARAFAAARAVASGGPNPAPGGSTSDAPLASAPDLSPLTELLWSGNAGQRTIAADLLGELGDAAAGPMLLDALRSPPLRTPAAERELLELQIREALATLGDREQIKPVRLATYSQHDVVRIEALLALGRLRDRGMVGNLVGFLAKNPAELRLAAAQALAEMADPEGLPVAQSGAREAAPGVRSQAALVFGALRHTPAAAAAEAELARLLDDPADAVRLSAAAGLVRRF